MLDLRAEVIKKITVRAGDLTVFLEAGAAARIEAEASAGISSEIDLHQAPLGRKVAAALGAGGPLIRLKALDGRIALKTAR